MSKSLRPESVRFRDEGRKVEERKNGNQLVHEIKFFGAALILIGHICSGFIDVSTILLVGKIKLWNCGHVSKQFYESSPIADTSEACIITTSSVTDIFNSLQDLIASQIL